MSGNVIAAWQRRAGPCDREGAMGESVSGSPLRWCSWGRGQERAGGSSRVSGGPLDLLKEQEYVGLIASTVGNIFFMLVVEWILCFSLGLPLCSCMDAD